MPSATPAAVCYVCGKREEGVKMPLTLCGERSVMWRHEAGRLGDYLKNIEWKAYDALDGTPIISPDSTSLEVSYEHLRHELVQIWEMARKAQGLDA